MDNCVILVRSTSSADGLQLDINLPWPGRGHQLRPWEAECYDARDLPGIAVRLYKSLVEILHNARVCDYTPVPRPVVVLPPDTYCLAGLRQMPAEMVYEVLLWHRAATCINRYLRERAIKHMRDYITSLGAERYLKAKRPDCKHRVPDCDNAEHYNVMHTYYILRGWCQKPPAVKSRIRHHLLNRRIAWEHHLHEWNRAPREASSFWRPYGMLVGEIEPHVLLDMRQRFQSGQEPAPPEDQDVLLNMFLAEYSDRGLDL